MTKTDEVKGRRDNRTLSELVMALNADNTNKLVDYLHILTKAQKKEELVGEEIPRIDKKNAQIREFRKENNPDDIPQAAVWAWWAASSLDIDMLSQAGIALSHIDLQKDPDGAAAVIECVRMYIMENIEYLMGHVADLRKALNDLYPKNEIWRDEA